MYFITFSEFEPVFHSPPLFTIMYLCEIFNSFICIPYIYI